MTDDELEAVRRVLARHREAIEARYRAVGTAIGKGSRGQPKYVIVVYLKARSNEPKGTVSVDGIPLEFKVTGPFSLRGPRR